MRTSGSRYVSIVLALLVGYFTYQWWFNPQRAIKRQLGALAATLSVPDSGWSDADRLGRAAALGRYLASNAHVQLGPAGPLLTSGAAVAQAFRAWTPPPGGLDVEFVDVQVTVDAPAAARAFITIELVGRDASGAKAREVRDARVSLTRLEEGWVIARADIGAPSAR